MRPALQATVGIGLVAAGDEVAAATETARQIAAAAPPISSISTGARRCMSGSAAPNRANNTSSSGA